MPVNYAPQHDITVDGLTQTQIERRMKDFLRTRLSTNFIMQDFMTGLSAINGDAPNYPKSNHAHIINSGKVLAGVCEALEAHFGRLAITYGYKTPEVAETQGARDSDPHCWDKGTKFKGDIFARMDVLIHQINDTHLTKHDVAQWLVKNTMVDLVMSFPNSNVLCITVCPRPRRVYKEWTLKGAGTNGSNSITHIGTQYWQVEYNTQADWLHAEGPPSKSGGHMNWFNKFTALGY